MGVAARDGQAAGQARVDVRVAVHEARHDDAAVGVDVLGTRVRGDELGLLAHRLDGITLDGHRPVLQEWHLCVTRDDPTVADNQHGAPFFVRAGFSTRA